VSNPRRIRQRVSSQGSACTSSRLVGGRSQHLMASQGATCALGAADRRECLRKGGGGLAWNFW
jgi:hypothetical protein